MIHNMFPEKCYLKKICKPIHAYSETSSVNPFGPRK